MLAISVAGPSVSRAEEPSPADVNKLLKELQHTIELQQQKIEEQERRLAAAERKVKEQELAGHRRQSQIQGLSTHLEQLSDNWLSEYGVVTYPDGRMMRQAAYRYYGESPTLAQTQPRAPQPLPPAEGSPRAPQQLPSAEGAPRAPQPPQPIEETPAAPPAGAGEKTVQEERPESERAVEELLVESGAVLLPAGTLQIEPSIEYTHVSTDRVAISGFTIFEAIVIGLIRVDEIDRDTITAALSARYGVFDRFQVEGRIPYVYRHDTELLGVGTNQQSELTIDGNDIGDVELSGSYQILKQDGWIPGTILRLRGRFPTGNSAFDIERQRVQVAETQQERLVETPTGSGFFAVAPGATFIWRIDPVAFFTGGSYTMNLERDQGEFGTIDPGDTAEFFAGMNISLSDRIGLNFSFVDQITFETVANGEKQVGSNLNDARLSLGSSIVLTPAFSLLTTAGVGLTDESPDFTFSVSVPISVSSLF